MAISKSSALARPYDLDAFTWERISSRGEDAVQTAVTGFLAGGEGSISILNA